MVDAAFQFVDNGAIELLLTCANAFVQHARLPSHCSSQYHDSRSAPLLPCSQARLDSTDGQSVNQPISSQSTVSCVGKRGTKIPGKKQDLSWLRSRRHHAQVPVRQLPVLPVFDPSTPPPQDSLVSAAVSLSGANFSLAPRDGDDFGGECDGGFGGFSGGGVPDTGGSVDTYGTAENPGAPGSTPSCVVATALGGMGSVAATAPMPAGSSSFGESRCVVATALDGLGCVAATAPTPVATREQCADDGENAKLFPSGSHFRISGIIGDDSAVDVDRLSTCPYDRDLSTSPSPDVLGIGDFIFDTIDTDFIAFRLDDDDDTPFGIDESDFVELAFVAGTTSEKFHEACDDFRADDAWCLACTAVWLAIALCIFYGSPATRQWLIAHVIKRCETQGGFLTVTAWQLSQLVWFTCVRLLVALGLLLDQAKTMISGLACGSPWLCCFSMVFLCAPLSLMIGQTAGGVAWWLGAVGFVFCARCRPLPLL